MGGGAAMRTAAKVGVGAANYGFRGEHPVSYAARKAAKPVSSSMPASSSSSTEGKLYVASQESSINPARPWSEFEGWEFAGIEGEEDYVPPRVVFGEAPSFVEAKEATCELKDALERTYLSSPASTGFRDSYQAGHAYGYSDVSQTKSCVTEKILAPAPSQQAIQAFRFLSETPAAQNVVASIASDPNVWNAVLQNRELQEFLELQKSNVSLKESITNDFFDQPSPKGSDGKSDNAESGGLAEFLNSIKVTVVDIWSSLSDYFQSLFSGPGAVYPNSDGSARIGFTDNALNGSFIGLAAMAILVVVLKRN